MKILAIDTASKSLSVALSDNDKLLDEAIIHLGLTHSENLMPQVKQILDNNKISISDIDLFAITSGPGSFTGLRIGISTVNSFAYALKKPCIGVPSLDVLAEMCKDFTGLIIPILNARRGEVYTAIYESDGSEIKRKSEYQAISLKELVWGLGELPQICFTGEGVIDYEDELRDLLKDSLVLPSSDSYHISASTLAKLAFEKKAYASAQVMPIYLRESEAVVRWKAEHPGETINGL